MSPTYIEVRAVIRYWEDAIIDGEEDTDGKLIPFRKGASWCPVIRLSDGCVMDWPDGMTADIHFKVCDEGQYWLLDEKRQRIAKWTNDYVPNDFLCHGDQGHGDYIIFSVRGDGFIKTFAKPTIVWVCTCDDDHDDIGWEKMEGGAA